MVDNPSGEATAALLVKEPISVEGTVKVGVIDESSNDVGIDKIVNSDVLEVAVAVVTVAVFCFVVAVAVGTKTFP